MNLCLVVSTVVLLAGTGVAAWGETPSCPKGWAVYNGTRCLSLFAKQEPWDEARVTMESRIPLVEGRRQCKYVEPESDLVIVDSVDKKAFVHTMIHANPPFLKCGLLGMNSYWIGANDRRQEFRFEWLDTQRRLVYTNWEFLEPNNILGEDCVEMMYKSGRWNDEDCNTEQCFVCEKAATG